MSKDHQFVVKSIVNGDRTPMYLETYAIGDRNSAVYKEAMQLLKRDDVQQEASLDMALEACKVKEAVDAPQMRHIDINAEEAAAVREAFGMNGRDAGVLEQDQRLNPYANTVLIPLEHGRQAWVKQDVLQELVATAVTEDWPVVRLRRVVEGLFNTPGTPYWYTVVEGWFNTAMEEERIRQRCVEEPHTWLDALREHHHPKQLSDEFVFESVDVAMHAGELTMDEASDVAFEVLGHPGTATEFEATLKERGIQLREWLYVTCFNRFTPTVEESKPHFVLGDARTHEIRSVTQTTYFRNERFEDFVAFGVAQGSRKQSEIIGVLRYELDTDENDPECVAVVHYQFFYQGDSVFVTDRYGNTVDRLR